MANGDILAQQLNEEASIGLWAHTAPTTYQDGGQSFTLATGKPIGAVDIRLRKPVVFDLHIANLT